jgi:hybrid cluster-associated redox disulfide protein
LFLQLIAQMQNKKPYVLKKDTLISEIVRDCPKAVELLAMYGLFCVNCFLNQFDTLETGTKLHHMSEEDSIKMIDEINGELAKEENWT